ncbi:SGNH/GDSL hydrolase family protein [Aeromicrobium piscarium]|uniref:SGNH/GDSL hydrolase family protein n=1 Tax=Aeromicrobium piscarium TaxID=2590901 RepID=A0A554RXD7_9ACTN|nr:SGNH/GDSL hydrolase family protein [Aeromicrobium piscarium]TSD58742.1 hypothetical protein FNM00_13880 [Aeromicrobium piscarium]
MSYSRPSLTVGLGVAILALGVGVLVLLALRPAPAPENAGAGVTPQSTPSESPRTTTPAPTGDADIVFIGDDHLEEWAGEAAAELGAEARIESGVTLFEDTTVADALEGSAPDLVVLSIGTADVVWADDFAFGLAQALDEIEEAWPASTIVLMRPAWEDPDDLQTEKIDSVEQTAQARDLIYLDAPPDAADFLDAWTAAGL